MEYKIGIVVLVLLFGFNNEVHCGSAVVITRPGSSDTSLEAEEALVVPQVIKFPMLDIFSKPKRSGGIKVTNRANAGLTGQSVRFKNKFVDESVRSKQTPKIKPQDPKPVPGYFSNAIDAVLQDPPPYNETARMARYVVANSYWTSMSTISSRAPTVGYPFSNIVSVSDGPVGKSTGIPYFYLTPLDLSVIDLKANNKASISMTLAQGDYCRRKHYDTEDPRCARVILTGKIVKIPAGSSEETAAKAAMFARHTGMSDWPKDHGFFCAKLVFSNILVLDYFGGVNTITIDEYFSSSPY